MREAWLLAGAIVLPAVAATRGAVIVGSASQATPAREEPPVKIAAVGKVTPSEMLSGLASRARSNGSPNSVFRRSTRPAANPVAT